MRWLRSPAAQDGEHGSLCVCHMLLWIMGQQVGVFLLTSNAFIHSFIHPPTVCLEQILEDD